MLTETPNALRFIDQAHKYGKAIAASGEGVELVKKTKAGELVNGDDAAEQGVLFEYEVDNLTANFIEAIASHRFHNREVHKIMA